ncbi:PREDICTED: uncharacterized protein LOC109126486 [Camelina sativa]|uniref:Uncharacterized protein LOC109126486 n=1 Tax=Camelina sativa TaxID=90675 RepID=A0ABM1QFS6_CAMSA|nr:PREDICTED: uncharacterized protein LOC109126486 [Camelina sativa]
MRDDKWRHAMSEEINAQIRRHTFNLVQSEVSSTRFQPTIWPGLLGDVQSSCQLDVKNAFLHGMLNEEVYVMQPPRFIDKYRPHHVCRLNKSLYGLKQAPRACDLGNRLELIHGFIDALARWFSLKTPTYVHYFLGIEATRTSQGLHLMQKWYIIDLLAKTNMLHCKPVTTPLSPHPPLTPTSGEPFDNPAQYRMVVDSLQYLSFTRPDLAFGVNCLSQFMHAPTVLHWQAVKRVLRYLAGTVTHGLLLHPGTPLMLHAYLDATWGGDQSDMISTNAYIAYLGTTPIAWCSKKQRGVTRSSTESEYRAVANATLEIMWICSLLTELGVRLPTPPVIYCDNMSATYLCANPVFHSRMKHIAIDFHFVREQVKSGALPVVHISTDDQLADALTKPLPRPCFVQLFNKIGVTHAPPS